MHYTDHQPSNAPEAGAHLARKWRSQQFSTIIGQDLVVRILKNSLYTQVYFPVYLFSGMHGCGKTTTARVFATAINCEHLSSFQQKPTAFEIPCLQCTSCQLMSRGKHPDFIEIDAASHTGVDNVRDIIDAASLLPVMSGKKIYLIDEAHMLSRAAFNAFLKILEEPPTSVVFMLATTEAHKVIDTVRSRCFQLFLQPVPLPVLMTHLEHVCIAEKLSYEQAGLEVIAQEASGSVRDALNTIERVRLAADKLSYEAVLTTLHHIDSGYVIDILEQVCAGNRSVLIGILEKVSFNRFCPSTIWKKLIEMIQAMVWLSYGVERPALARYQERLKTLAEKKTADYFIAMLEKFYDYELILVKTTAQHTLISTVLLSLCNENESQTPSPSALPHVREAQASLTPPFTKIIPNEVIPSYQIEQTAHHKESTGDHWQTFVAEIDRALDDPLVSSLFKQARFVKFDEDRGVVELAFSKKLSFFSEMLHSTQHVWEPVLRKIFGVSAQCKSEFTDENVDLKPINIPSATAPQGIKLERDAVTQPVRVSSSELRYGKNARILLQFFPGSLSLIRQHDE